MVSRSRPRSAPAHSCLTGGGVAHRLALVPSRPLVLLLLCAGCAAAGRADRPPAPEPAPSQAAISNVGFDRAVRLGSDYVAANTGVDQAKVNKTQEIPGGMVQL